MIAMYLRDRVHRPHGCRKGKKYIWAHVDTVQFSPASNEENGGVRAWCLFGSWKEFERYRYHNFFCKVLSHGTVVWK